MNGDAQNFMLQPSYPFIDEILRNADEFSENRSSISLLSMTEVYPSTLSFTLQVNLIHI